MIPAQEVLMRGVRYQAGLAGLIGLKTKIT
jgi:hypothetical protein